MQNILTLILFSLICIFKINAQDIHFSQFNASPLNLNPALAGDFDGEHRITANHRNQWSSITVPYKTYALSYDIKISKTPVKNSFAGIGLQLNTDKAGDGDFGTTQIKLTPAFHKIITADTSLIVSIGFNVAYNQHSVDFDAFYFGNQYRGGMFNSSIPHNEFFSDNSFSYFDFAVGAKVLYYANGIPVNLGIALTHLNKPRQSFYNNELVELNRKFNIHANSLIYVNKNLNAIPSIAYFRQGKFQELNIGGLLQKALDDYNFRNIYFGGWVRASDAGILKFGFDYKDINVGISYDINFSKLRIASESRGGIELSFIYIIKDTKLYKVPYHRQCPVFM